MMQLRDKIDLSFVKDKKNLIRKIVFSVLKFVIITVVVFALVLVCSKLLVLFWADEIPSVMVFTLTLFFLLSVISCTAGLVKTMYFADDNKVLVTFPMGEGVVFLSKLLVFYFYEIIKSFTLLYPIVIGFLISMFTVNMLPWWAFIAVWIPMLIYTALPVVVGALLSVPMQYVVRFFMRFKAFGYALFVIVLAAIVVGIVSLINVMPENINIMSLYQTTLKPAIHNFLQGFQSRFAAFSQIVYIFIGEKTPSGLYAYSFTTFLKFLAMIGIIAALFALVFVTTRFVFYAIMRKSFEFDKKPFASAKKNVVHSSNVSFLIKELRLNFRSIGTVLNFLSVYIIVPIMILLMNKVFSLLSTSLRGDNLVFAFNVLIISLPLFASNAIIATSFSAEGRAAYIKKTKPVNVTWPLTAKLLPNLVGSLFSVLISISVFNYFADLSFGFVAMLFIGILFMHYGHIFFSATLDLMNPQNEQFATTGELHGNANENISTVSAFVLSAIYAFVSFVFLGESSTTPGGLTLAYAKLMLLGVIVFVAAFYMYSMKIKAYYYEK